MLVSVLSCTLNKFPTNDYMFSHITITLYYNIYMYMVYVYV